MNMNTKARERKFRNRRLLPTLFWLVVTQAFIPLRADAEITIIQRESSSRLRVFAGSGGAVQVDDETESLDDLTGIFSFERAFNHMVTENDPFSNGAAMSTGSVIVTDDVEQISNHAICVQSSRTSTASVQHLSGTGSATSAPRHTCRVRFSVTEQPVRYKINGNFAPGPLANGQSSLSLYRPFTANTFFEFLEPAAVAETGILQPGLTYEIEVRVVDQLSAGANNPGPESETSSYDLALSVATAIVGDTNMDGNVNLLDVSPFIEALSGGVDLFEADVNQDGEVNLLDVDPFIDLLAN